MQQGDNAFEYVVIFPSVSAFGDVGYKLPGSHSKWMQNRADAESDEKKGRVCNDRARREQEI